MSIRVIVANIESSKSLHVVTIIHSKIKEINTNFGMFTHITDK